MRCSLLACVLLACGDDDVAKPQTDASLPDTSLPDTSLVPDTSDAYVDAGPEKVVWAHTASKLFRFDPDSRALTLVGTFSCAADLVLNIAVNADQQIYGVTSQGLVTIDRKTAACFPIASGVYPHALAFVPKGTFDPDKETLVGYRFAQYVRINETTGEQTPVGSMNPNITNLYFSVSGDLFALGDGHLFVTVTNGSKGDQIVEANPKSGKVLSVVGDTNALSLLGFAQWAGTGYVFGADGHAYAVDLKDAGLSQVYPPLDGGADAEMLSFTGAGVTTRAPISIDP